MPLDGKLDSPLLLVIFSCHIRRRTISWTIRNHSRLSSAPSCLTSLRTHGRHQPASHRSCRDGKWRSRVSTTICLTEIAKITLRDQLQSLRSEFVRLTSQTVEVENLRSTVSQLTEQVQALRIQSSKAEQLEQELRALRTQSSRAEQLEEEMRAMKEEIAALRAARPDHVNHQRVGSIGKTM